MDFVPSRRRIRFGPFEMWRWLEEAYEERSAWMVYLNTDPRYDGLPSQPRFQELQRRVGFAGLARISMSSLLDATVLRAQVL